MTRLLSRRRVLGAGGAAALVPVMGRPTAAGAATLGGQIVTLRTAIRVYDSRTSSILGGRKLGPGDSLDVAVSPALEENLALAVFLNCSITETEGSGFLVLRPTDTSGEAPFPATSNINWWASGLTLGNASLVAVGSENSIEIHCRGAGRTHVIIDVQGYVPFVT
jgi:hypothetical protein